MTRGRIRPAAVLTAAGCVVLVTMAAAGLVPAAIAAAAVAALALV